MKDPTRAWRIVKKKHIGRAFDGGGARRMGGRWNSPGVAMVYTSATISLALLETFVHADQEDLAAGRFLAIPVDIPAIVRVKQIDRKMLPKDWRKWDPSPPELRKIGDEWVREGRQAVLVVPSAVLPQERNYLINPANKDVKRLIIGPPEQISIDGRIVKDEKP